MTTTIQINNHEVIKQAGSLMADPEYRESLAKAHAALILEEQRRQLGEHVGELFPIPISLASRISGWSEKWIRRNLKIRQSEGQNDSIEFGELVRASKERTTGK